MKSAPPSSPSLRAARSLLLAGFALLAPWVVSNAQPVAAASAASAVPHVPRPQDDLWLSVNGDWDASTLLPTDAWEVSTFSELRARIDDQLHQQLEALAASSPPPTGEQRKLADFYRAWNDTDEIDRRGLVTLAPSLQAIAQASTAGELMHQFVALQRIATMPIYLRPTRGSAADGRQRLMIETDGLGLNAATLLAEDAGSQQQRQLYRDYLGKLLALSGDAQADADARLVLDLETHLAKLQRGLAAAGTHPAGKAIDAKAASALDIDLHALTRAAGLSGAPEVVEMTPGYLAALAGLLRSEPPGAWQAYLTVRRVDAVALALPRAFRDAHFEFHGHAMGGLRAQRPRWRLAMSALDLAMGDAVGRLYTSRWLAPGTKAQADRMAERIRTTFSAAVAHADWMTPATRAVAREKLDKLVIGIGVPPRARQFSGLEIRPDDALGNLDRAHESEFREDMARVGTPVDRGLWGMPAHKANAYYNPDDNAIVLPAALLQPPFFFPGGDAAANDGTLGATIAELMSESLTDSGTMFDAEGRPRPWWTQADRREFDRRVEPLVAQYGAYEARPGKTVNGRLTLSQNVADLSGLEIAFAAFQRDQAVLASPVIDGVPAAQRFFIAFAAQYRSKAWSQRIDYALTRDPHAPARFRADGPAANLDGFHQTYATQPGDRMWRSPADRVHVW